MQGLSLGPDADKKALIEEVKVKVDVYKKVVQRRVLLPIAARAFSLVKSCS